MELAEEIIGEWAPFWTQGEQLVFGARGSSKSTVEHRKPRLALRRDTEDTWTVRYNAQPVRAAALKQQRARRAGNKSYGPRTSPVWINLGNSRAELEPLLRAVKSGYEWVLITPDDQFVADMQDADIALQYHAALRELLGAPIAFRARIGEVELALPEGAAVPSALIDLFEPWRQEGPPEQKSRRQEYLRHLEPAPPAEPAPSAPENPRARQTVPQEKPRQRPPTFAQSVARALPWFPAAEQLRVAPTWPAKPGLPMPPRLDGAMLSWLELYLLRLAFARFYSIPRSGAQPAATEAQPAATEASASGNEHGTAAIILTSLERDLVGRPASPADDLLSAAVHDPNPGNILRVAKSLQGDRAILSSLARVAALARHDNALRLPPEQTDQYDYDDETDYYETDYYGAEAEEHHEDGPDEASGHDDSAVRQPVRDIRALIEEALRQRPYQPVGPREIGGGEDWKGTCNDPVFQYFIDQARATDYWESMKMPGRRR